MLLNILSINYELLDWQVKMVIVYGPTEDGMQSDLGRCFLATYNLFVLLASLLGDSLIIIATTRYNAIKLNKVHVAVMQHLAVADLLTSIFYVFPVIVAELTNRWVLGEFMCHLHSLARIWLYSAVLGLTCTLTTTKLLTVKFPFRCRIWSARGAHCVCLFIWVAAFVSLISLLDSYNNEYFLFFSYAKYSCFLKVKHDRIPSWCNHLTIIVWSIHTVLIATVILTSLLLVVEAKRAASRNNRSVRWEGILTVILTGAVVVVSFVPIAVFWLTPKIYYSASITRSAGILFNLNVMANFFIYAMTVQSFREFLKEKIINFLDTFCLIGETRPEEP